MSPVYVTSKIRLVLDKQDDDGVWDAELQQMLCPPPIVRRNLTVKQNILRAFCINKYEGIKLKRSIPDMDASSLLGRADGLAAGLLWSLSYDKYSPKAEDTSFSI